MKKVLWFRKIQFQIPVIVFLTFLIPSAIFYLYDCGISRATARQNAQTAMSERLNRTALLLQDIMQDVEAAARSLSEDQDFVRSLSDYCAQPDAPATQSRLLLMLGQAAWPCDMVQQICLIVENTPLILTSDPEQKRLEIDAAGRELWTQYQNGMEAQTGWTSCAEQHSIAYWRSVSDSEGKPCGALFCVLKQEYLEQSMEELHSQPESLNAVTTYQGRVLYCDRWNEAPLRLDTAPLFEDAYSAHQNEGSYFASDDGTAWLVTYYNSLEDGWKYVSAVPEHQIYEQGADFGLLVVLLGAGLVSILFGSIVLYGLVIRPLGRLQRQMVQMEQGHLNVMESIKGHNEISLVLREYNRMVERLKKLIDESYIQQQLRLQAELSSLQSQVDEHFLYNTLNAVYCKASEEGAAVSAAMILRLSQYFRLCLSRGQEKILLSEVLELIQAYLQIQQMRFEQRLTCRLETFPDMDQYVSLKWLYQPIVENAIVHGFERKLGSHSLDIRFQAEGELLRFTVRDDGAGMSEELCRQVTTQMNTFDKIQAKGYALRNIQEQIRIAYGEGYGIKIDSRIGEGTTVTLEVPLERRPA